jgi:protein-S-isoprenylcysteine O-methyltransferase Ste14
VKRERLHLIARWALITASLSALLFLAAGTTHVTSIRRYLLVFSALLLGTMLTVDPRLAKERAHPRDAGIDDGLGFAAGFLSLVTLIVAALSVGRLRPCFNVSIPLRDAALAVLALSGSLQTWAMIVNPFFSPVIRLQTECSHRVIESGPYKFMRHPGYFAMLISIPASALAVGSWLALIPALGFVLVVSRRARLEDEFLMRNLSGYRSYAGQIRGGLFPTAEVWRVFSPARIPARISRISKSWSKTWLSDLNSKY